MPKLRLHERGMAACGRMFQQMPDDLPPKRMMRGIEEIRANTARTLELLEEGTGLKGRATSQPRQRQGVEEVRS